ncbi:hypothetical protein [Flavihumibacter solisilvae]|nr:hypothetical protein [Flavihumibacter solisilvae]
MPRILRQLEKSGYQYVQPRAQFICYPVMGQLTQDKTCFDSLIFLSLQKGQVKEVLAIPGIRNVMYYLSEPAVISRDEIELIKVFTDRYSNIYIEEIPVKQNCIPQITHGPFLLREGDIVGIKNQTIKATLPSLGFVMIAESDGKEVAFLHVLEQIASSKV